VSPLAVASGLSSLCKSPVLANTRPEKHARSFSGNTQELRKREYVNKAFAPAIIQTDTHSRARTTWAAGLLPGPE